MKNSNQQKYLLFLLINDVIVHKFDIGRSPNSKFESRRQVVLGGVHKS